MTIKSLGKYTILAELGRGGFGTVYRVTHLKLKQERAVKVLSLNMPGVGTTDLHKAAERFELEVQIGAKLEHVNVIKVYDFEKAEGEVFLVMEYAPGGSLPDRTCLAKRPAPAHGGGRHVLLGALGMGAGELGRIRSCDEKFVWANSPGG
jgi:serine/threonine protein kinase